MYHLDNTSGVPEMPEPKDQQSINPRWFGESQEQGGISWPGADWFNIIQAELLNILSDAGIPAEKNTYDQICKAIKQIGGDKLRSDLSARRGFNIVGQVQSASALATLTGEDGERVLLMGYNPGWAATKSELSGCGEFYYVSSLADV
ncbi:TPA: hypothetical protein ACK1Z8_004668, partial [Klebsiella michiganensis]